MAESYRPRDAEAGVASAERKTAAVILPAYCFVPLDFETSGRVNEVGLVFFNSSVHRLAQITEDKTELNLYQRLSVAVKRIDAKANHNTFGIDDE